MAIIAAPTKTPPSGNNGATQQAVAPNPFTKASKRLTEPFIDVTRALGAGSIRLEQQAVPATGYLRSIVIDVEVTGTTGATYNADAPWNVIEQISLNDVNGQPLVQLSGFNLYLANKYGGYVFHADPAEYINFDSSGTGFRFQLRIPVEIVQRNALGALSNMNQAMTYKVNIALAPIADVYASNGTGASARVRGTVESWMNPLATGLDGTPNSTTPPALGTTQNWSEYVAPVSVGQNTIRLPRVGNTIRELIWVARDASGDRTDTIIPPTLQLLLDGNNWRQNTFDYELQRIFELYGYDATQRDTGVWVLALNDDFDGTPGDEIGDYWLETTGATRLELQGVAAAAGTLTVVTNDILAYAATAGPGQTLAS